MNENVVILTHRSMSKEPPFSGSDDIAVKTYPPVESLIKFLEKKLPKKVNSEKTVMLKKIVETLIAKIEELALDDEQAFVEAEKVGLKPVPQQTRFSALIAKLQLNTELNRYTQITFKPTSALVRNPMSGFDRYTLNTFNGFTLNKYTPGG